MKKGMYKDDYQDDSWCLAEFFLTPCQPGSGNDAAWRSYSLANKVYYEIGQKTLNTLPGGFNALDAAAKGRRIVTEMGWFNALRPTRSGLVLGAGKTFWTGPTPAFRWLFPRAVGGTAVYGYRFTNWLWSPDRPWGRWVDWWY